MSKFRFLPEWDKEAAEATYRRYAKSPEGNLYRRPNGEVRYSLMHVDEIPDVGWGIRIRCWPSGKTYVIAHNTIMEEKWVHA